LSAELSPKNEASVLRLGKEDVSGHLGQERQLPPGFVDAP
jgi:hypothetical protein